jgi:hypothetical protein
LVRIAPIVLAAAGEVVKGLSGGSRGSRFERRGTIFGDRVKHLFRGHSDHVRRNTVAVGKCLARGPGLGQGGMGGGGEVILGDFHFRGRSPIGDDELEEAYGSPSFTDVYTHIIHTDESHERINNHTTPYSCATISRPDSIWSAPSASTAHIRGWRTAGHMKSSNFTPKLLSDHTLQTSKNPTRHTF